MKFLIDAQLPKSLATFLREKGFDAIHTIELPNGNATTDAEINQISISERRIVVTKDGDFFNIFAARKEPYKLLHVRTGNISNAKLFEIFEKNLEAMIGELTESNVIEIDQHY